MSFQNFGLKPELLCAVEKNKFEHPTSIQQKCIPLILQGRDVVGQSKTGSGKTAAFGLPILNMIQGRDPVQCLILTPTRELCVQITEVFELFGRPLGIRVASVYGGVGINPQIDAIKQCQVIVATPGRTLDHIGRGTLNLSRIKFLVLDEVDRMSDMGFIEDVSEIISYTPKQRQTLLFSATITNSVREIIKKYLHNPETVTTESYVEKHLLEQSYYNVQAYDKFSLLAHLIRQHPDESCIVFCSTRDNVDLIAKNLKNQGLKAMAIHGGITQNRRQQSIEAIKDEHTKILVATDVAARGLDINNVNFVYNYDVPKCSEDYIHRIGRTARAGKSGRAVTILSERDYDNFRRVQQDSSLNINREELPEFPRVRFERHARSYGGSSGGSGGFRRKAVHYGDRDRQGRPQQGGGSASRNPHFKGRGHPQRPHHQGGQSRSHSQG